MRQTNQLMRIMHRAFFTCVLTTCCLAAVAHAGPGAEQRQTYLPMIGQAWAATWHWAPAANVTLTPRPETNRAPRMVIDHSGQVHLLWGTADYAAPRFIYHTYLTATGWLTPTVVAPSLGFSSAPSTPLVAADGAMHLMWLNQLTSQDPPRVLYAVFRDGRWSAEEEIYRASSGDSYVEGMPQVDAAGRISGTIQIIHLSRYLYQTSRTTNGWTPPVQIPTADFWLFVALPDRSGGVHIYNRAPAASTYAYSYWVNGGFQVHNRPTGADLYDRSTQLDAGHNLQIYWTGYVPVPGGQVTGLFHQCLDANLNLTAAEVLSGVSPATHVAGATDAQGRFALTWRESATNRARFAIWEGCARTTTTTVPAPQASAWYPIALALSDTPNQLCALSAPPTYTGPFSVQCVIF